MFQVTIELEQNNTKSLFHFPPQKKKQLLISTAQFIRKVFAWYENYFKEQST